MGKWWYVQMLGALVTWSCFLLPDYLGWRYRMIFAVLGFALCIFGYVKIMRSKQKYESGGRKPSRKRQAGVRTKPLIARSEDGTLDVRPKMHLTETSAVATAEIRTIPVRQSTYSSANPSDLIDALIDICKYLQTYGTYRLEEFPLVLRYNLFLSQYFIQVNNGGHEQFVRNCGWLPELQESVDAGLAAIGADGCQRVFREVAQYINASPERVLAVAARGGFNHPTYGPVDKWISDKDSEYFKLKDSTDLLHTLHAWLKQQPCIQPVEDLQWKFEMEELIAGNPLRESRLEQAGEQKRDFVEDLIENAPMKKSYHEYACEIAKSRGIELPFLAKGSWTEVIDGEECSLAHFVVGEKQYLASWSEEKAQLFVMRKRLFGKGLVVGRKLGTRMIEYQEV